MTYHTLSYTKVTYTVIQYSDIHCHTLKWHTLSYTKVTCHTLSYTKVTCHTLSYTSHPVRHRQVVHRLVAQRLCGRAASAPSGASVVKASVGNTSTSRPVTASWHFQISGDEILKFWAKHPSKIENALRTEIRTRSVPKAQIRQGLVVRLWHLHGAAALSEPRDFDQPLWWKCGNSETNKMRISEFHAFYMASSWLHDDWLLRSHFRPPDIARSTTQQESHHTTAIPWNPQRSVVRDPFLIQTMADVTCFEGFEQSNAQHSHRMMNLDEFRSTNEAFLHTMLRLPGVTFCTLRSKEKWSANVSWNEMTVTI